MSYKIGEFCRLLGISPDTIRFYERCRLLSTSKNPQNKYRAFTKRDAPDIWNLQMLRSMDMSLKDMDDLRKKGTFESQMRYLQSREKALALEIEALTLKRERLMQLSRIYNVAQKINQAYLQNKMPASYALYVFGDGCLLEEQLLAEVPRWIACLPFAYFAVEISMESLLEKRTVLAIRLGLGILEENRERAKLTIPVAAEYIPQSICVCIAVQTRDIFSLTNEDLSPLYAFLEENHLHITGPASGRIICSTCQAKDSEYIIGLSVPVEKLTNTP